MIFYTAQWLPVKGEPGPGDFFCEDVDGNIEPQSYDKAMFKPTVARGCHRLEKFLLTQTYEVGDLVVDLYRPAEYGTVQRIEKGEVYIDWIDSPTVSKRKYHIFGRNDIAKVLGKVSIEAIWVAIDSIIEQTDIAWMSDSGDDTIYPLEQMKEDQLNDLKGSKRMEFAIRCPSCKTFH